ncbi:MAG: DegT/DnrJ/EryC1/StrS family aminotransferase [Nitrososphaerota archaeon]|nr:DegT/DnrJ/EryC1/StrS family aminotransferase [Candidatus Calditenuaceae archaeon]MDW8073468.1 DegT/DnrJ/EryC1/StrS family aminotransferase [Nitrososphaerota archaeon]
MGRLAVKGGSPAAKDLLKLVPPWPTYGEKEKQALIEVLESRRWCRIFPGSRAELLESVFAEYHHAKHGIAVANGTVALELALKTVGVKTGDKVIVPAVTFIASASAATELGAIPVFADVDAETGNISPRSVREILGREDGVKAVVAVHYGGNPVNFDELRPLLAKRGVKLIEDCAHAHGSEWRGRRVGAIGDMGGFSFQESKSLTAGEGGIVLTDSDEYANKARLIHNIGRVVGRPGYEHYILSSNYRMTEFQAALLLAKIDELKEQVEKKHRNGAYLADRLRKIGGVEPQKMEEGVTKRGYYYFVFRYDAEEFGGVPKRRFVEALRAEGVPVDVGYGMPLYKQKAFSREAFLEVMPAGTEYPDYDKMHLPGAEEFTKREVTLLHYYLLGEREALDLIAAAIEKIKENIGELAA